MNRSWIASFVLFSACTASFQPCEAAGPSTAPVELNAPLRKLEIKAVMGDPDAASKLSDYYRYEKTLNSKWKYWARIAAENGDPGSQFDEYNILRMSTDPLFQRRAFYWLKKSKESGFSDSKLELERCFPSGTFKKRNLDCFGKNAR
jgi:hypothetical protein